LQLDDMIKIDVDHRLAGYVFALHTHFAPERWPD
jgi:hypothetical protein